MFSHIKRYKIEQKTTQFWCKLNTHFLLNFASNFLPFFFFFSFLAQKTLKKHNLTSIWSVQYPNTGQSIIDNFEKIHAIVPKRVKLYFIIVKAHNNSTVLTNSSLKRVKLSFMVSAHVIVYWNRQRPNFICTFSWKAVVSTILFPSHFARFCIV